MMRCFDVKPHLRQRDDQITPDIFSRISRCLIKVTAVILKVNGCMTIYQTEEEKLHLRPHIKGVPGLCRLVDLSTQNVARITGKWLAACGVHIADKPCSPELFIGPWNDLVCCRIGAEQHIRLLKSRKPLNG